MTSADRVTSIARLRELGTCDFGLISALKFRFGYFAEAIWLSACTSANFLFNLLALKNINIIYQLA